MCLIFGAMAEVVQRSTCNHVDGRPAIAVTLRSAEWLILDPGAAIAAGCTITVS
jgi:hypothetical protein